MRFHKLGCLQAMIIELATIRVCHIVEQHTYIRLDSAAHRNAVRQVGGVAANNILLVVLRYMSDHAANVSCGVSALGDTPISAL